MTTENPKHPALPKYLYATGAWSKEVHAYTQEEWGLGGSLPSGGNYQARTFHTDRAQAEIAEAEVIEAYLPKALTREEAEAIVDEAITGLKADGTELSMRSMGIVMKSVTPKIAGRFDGKAVSEIVRGRLV